MEARATSTPVFFVPFAMDPPRLTFTYDDLISRVERLCRGAAKPVGSSIAGSLTHMGRIAGEHPGLPVLEWDEEKGVLEIPDPYLLFYLRWSGFLSKAE
jgi:hypothetical protein